jgi:uncharacterized RDD family membrane protein YckC
VGQLILVDEQLRLGSSEEGDGSLGGDRALSSEHALLTCELAGEWVVRDLGSEGGTYLNGRPLASAESFYRGDTLRVGESKLLVVDGPHRAPREGVQLPGPIEPPIFPAPRQEPKETEAGTPAPPLKLGPGITTYRKRRRAYVIDSLIASAIATGVVFALGLRPFSGFVAIAVVLAWDFLFESLRGQTIGKRVMKIRVVRRDGSRLQPQHVAARSVLRIVDGVPGLPLVGLLSMILTGPSRRQRLGDLAGGTIVVESERMMSTLPPTTRDRLILFGYPVLWIVPVIVWALMTPGATTQFCRQGQLSSLNPPEGTCLARDAVVTAVNPGHTLHWRGFDISLRAARERTSGRSALVAYKLAVTNTTARPQGLDHESMQLALNVPVLGGGKVRSARDLPRTVKLHGLRAIADGRSIAPGRTRVGWERFLVPSEVVPLLNNSLASLSFLPPMGAGGGLPDLGVLRLWNPATAQGAAAIHVRRS